MSGIDTLDKVIPFRITASEAEALSRLDTLKAHNLPISHQDTAPFSVSVSNAYPAGHKSRFSLPLLSFQREPVALAGFRNKDGFVLIRSGLPEQVERAVISRFNSLIQLTKQSLRALREEQRDLDERAQSVMTANGEPIMEMKGYKINRYAYSDGHVQTHLQPSQVHNRLTLAFPDSVKGRHVRGGAFMLSVETPAFNLVKVLLTFHKTHHGTHIVTGNGNEGLVLRNIVAGQEKLETSLNIEVVRDELRQIAPLKEGEEMDAWRQFSLALKNRDQHKPVGRYSLDPSRFGGCLMRDGLIVAEIASQSLRVCPDFKEAIHRLPGGIARLSRLTLTAAGVIREPDVAAAVEQDEWARELEDAVRGTDFRYF